MNIYEKEKKHICDILSLFKKYKDIRERFGGGDEYDDNRRDFTAHWDRILQNFVSHYALIVAVEERVEWIWTHSSGLRCRNLFRTVSWRGSLRVQATEPFRHADPSVVIDVAIPRKLLAASS